MATRPEKNADSIKIESQKKTQKENSYFANAMRYIMHEATTTKNNLSKCARC